MLLHVLEEGAAAALVLHFQEMLGALALLLSPFIEKVARTLQSHITVVSIKAQREVSVGGQQRCVDQADDRGLHLRGMILTILGAHS